MKRRTEAAISVAVVLAAFGCSGRSSSVFTEPKGTGAQGGSGGGGTTGGTSGSGGTGGDGASGGASDAGSTGGGTTGGSSGSSTGGSSAGAMSGGAGDGGMTSAGAGGVAGGGTAGGSGAAGLTLTGTWSMFLFEDPVTVSIKQSGSTLTGKGCCAGLDSSLIQCCGELTGQVSDGVATFSFPAGDFATYGARVYVSPGFERLGGSFSAGGGEMKTAWVRQEPPSLWLREDPSLAEAVGEARSGRYELLLTSARAGRFEPGQAYALYLDVRPEHVLVSGTLGPFYNREMTFDDATQALHVGPVPATDPEFAAELELEFSGDDLERVLATYAGEDTPYVFTATRQ